LMMSLWDALRMNMMISYQELVRTFPRAYQKNADGGQYTHCGEFSDRLWFHISGHLLSYGRYEPKP
ncbi:hypothetical protein KQE47_24015, partial [Raoultella planticola]|nr:hypothetical protein [Raoultella planticola]MDC3911435.1 hypothetical protein [Raoultella planticola]